MAAEIGLEPHKLSKSVAGIRVLQEAELVALSAALGVSTAYLKTGDEKSAPRQPHTLSPERRILDSAAERIATQGFHSVRIADIASASNVSTGTVHYYFPTRDDVLTAALQHYAERMFVRVQKRLAASHSDPAEQIRYLINSQLPLDPTVSNEWSVWVQFWNEAMLVPNLRPAHNALYERWKTLVRSVVTNAQTNGVITVRDASMVATQFTALVDGTAIQLLTGAPGMTADIMRTLLTQVFWPEMNGS
ncbi:TetR/AcrR family transcriptional regulator [Rhodococcus globerulus]|uniref:TetR/AcrR family transcriptional regulator n=1 Tax=Rhodococcus globerulus TaxID=33008 RepID=A0ABU4C4F4_RHOGO|nr:TetR/AcrR family transcriptional regulator [Rhodococcus globerulus]MDV6271179.1 TetR/AcrR family transcriptional regulator [Rhodococcus globerulus]